MQNSLKEVQKNFFEKFEKTIKIKTDEYEEIYKAKQEQ